MMIGIAVLVAVLICAAHIASRRDGTDLNPDIALVMNPDATTRSQVPTTLEANCSECHEREVESWQKSQHALANRLVDASVDRAAFESDHELRVGGFRTRMTMHDGAPTFTVTTPAGEEQQYQPEAVIGIEPLIQYLVSSGDPSTPQPSPSPPGRRYAAAGGRLQAIDAAYDTQSRQWFHVFGGEERFEHEWGYWKNRGMNWNVQCAACHMTGFKKNYEQDTDTYQSTWDAMGISCRQCHGPQPKHAAAPYADDWEGVYPSMDRVDHMQVCATCHARREELTGQFKPGDSFNDHYRLTLATDGEMYYADGQVREENYEYGSFLLSRLSLKGVTCMNCHDPHSGKLLMPVSDNSLCMSCHTAPGWNGAVVIDPLAHSHHNPGSTGNRCVECHMPITKYMVRDPRRDHGFTVPDPQLTEELGIPNACNRCHTDRSTAWAIEGTEKWYGEKLAERRSRKRARLIERARQGDRSVTDELLSMTRHEEVPAWRAALIVLLDPGLASSSTRQFLAKSLEHQNALVRAAAIRALAPAAGAYSLLWTLRNDSNRLVRLDASWATLHPSIRESTSNTELMAYLELNSDQPAGVARQAQLALTERRMDDAVRWIDKAADWDPSAGSYHLKGRVYHATGRIPEAETALQKAVDLDPRVADHHYALALLHAELERPQKALLALQETIKADPAFGRAWYNLGLGHAALEQFDEAIAALQKAELLMPDSPDAAFARATVHLRQNDPSRARAAIKAALKIQPDFAPALQMLRTIEQ